MASSGNPAFLADIIKLIKARRLLAATMDNRRAIIGEISREWIKSEVEQSIPFNQLPKELRQHPATGLLADSNEHLSDEITGKQFRINTNRLPKLEPVISAHILTGVILYGARLYGSGTPDPQQGVMFREIENDLIIAAMIHESLGLLDRYSALLPEDYRTVDEDYIIEEFGSRVLHHVNVLKVHLNDFEAACNTGEIENLNIPREYANAIAAIIVSRLRLTARVAGDQIFSTFDQPKREELSSKGIDLGDSGEYFPERKYLERDFHAARKSMMLPGVDRSTIKEPVTEQLLRSIENVLKYGAPVEQLVGRYGAAVHNFHTALPLMERYNPFSRRTVGLGEDHQIDIEGPYALGTLHLTGLEVTRYLHKVRRKGMGTGAGHSFIVGARVASFIGEYLTVPFITGSDSHDVIEDGGAIVTGYDQTLELFAARFGSPLAALVAEVTDSVNKADGPTKARVFAATPYISHPEDLYNVGQLEELRSVATNPNIPYTLAGVLMKIADFGITQEEGIRDSDMMIGPWLHSGARINWDQYSKGDIIRPLLQRLAIEILVSETDPFYYEKKGSLEKPLIGRLREIIRWSFDVADQYMVQNLTILADEYHLSEDQWQELVVAFTEKENNRHQFEQFLNDLLRDEQMDEKIKKKGYAATYRISQDGEVERNLSKLLDYRETAIWRKKLRQQLGLEPLSERMLSDVIKLYRMR